MNDTSVSVTRSFRVFDALAKARQPLSSAEIARLIEAPRSSTADLLRTLVGLNLLSIDRRSATYFPTARFASLGSWLESSWLGQAGLRDALRELASASGETTVLARPPTWMSRSSPSLKVPQVLHGRPRSVSDFPSSARRQERVIYRPYRPRPFERCIVGPRAKNAPSCRSFRPF